MLHHPDRDRGEREDCERLIGPAEVTPYGIESVRIVLCPDKHEECCGKYGKCEQQTFAAAVLLDAECVCQDEPHGSQCGVAARNGKYDDSDDRDHSADRAQHILADHTDYAGRGDRLNDAVDIGKIAPSRVRLCDGYAGLFGAEAYHCHSSCRPDHSDEAFCDHHVVEGRAALLFALESAGNESDLGRVEAREYTAGHGNEEYRDEVLGLEVVVVVEGVNGVRVPQFDEVVASYEHYYEDGKRCEY